MCRLICDRLNNMINDDGVTLPGNLGLQVSTRLAEKRAEVGATDTLCVS